VRCGVTSAVVQVVDADGALVHPLHSRCRLCGEQSENGARTAEGIDLRDPTAVHAAFARWAAEDGEPDIDAFARANFGGRTVAEVVEAVLAGEPVDTGFDVVAWLFGGIGSGVVSASHTLGAQAARVAAVTRSADGLGDRLPSTGAADVAGRFDPRDVTRALVSAMLADGAATEAERGAIEAEALRLGGAAVTSDDLHVWRPQELGPVRDPGAVLASMIRVATSDGTIDASGRRVLREYARTWGVPLDESALPAADVVEGAMRIVARLFIRTAEPSGARTDRA
jgi:tellurite resistance protein